MLGFALFLAIAATHGSCFQHSSFAVKSALLPALSGRACTAPPSLQSPQCMSHIAADPLPTQRRNLVGAILAAGIGLALPGATKSGAADLEQYSGSNPRAYVIRGMERFRKGLVKESIQDFDKAIELDGAEAGLLWQRGLSLYYADRFDDAAVQFRRDVALNPRDTEEAVWNFLAQARQSGGSVEKAQEQMISIVGETRPYMKVVYDVYAGKRDVSELESLAIKADESMASPQKKRGGLFSFGEGRDEALQTSFYSWLYLGLWEEARGRREEARRCLLKAAGSEYGRSQDYMWYLAAVHCKVRGWQ